MASKQEVQAVSKLVTGKFSSEYQIESKPQSPNGHHFVLQKKGEKKHLKVIDSSSFDKEGINEIELLEAISSPNVIKLEEHGSLGESFTYLIFPHINGKTLDKLSTEGGWNVSDLEKLALDLSIAISAMNKAGIVHRDIKPKNIIKEESSGNYILLDLGIGYFVDQADRDNSKARGSRNYSSPEQFKSIESDTDDISQASDQFSLGVILYQLATTEHPFEDYNKKRYTTIGEAICKMPAQPISALRSDIGLPLQQTIMRLLEKNPSKRYWKPEDIQNHLKGVIVDEVQKLQYYITDPKSLDFIEEYLDDNNFVDRPEGVMLSVCSSDERIKKMKAKGLAVLIDPESYKLPYPKASQAQIRKKLNLGDKPLTMTKINDDKFLKRLVEKILVQQEPASAIILPHFTINTLEDESIEINRKVEDIYFNHIQEQGEIRDVYAGIMIARPLIINSASRTKLLDRLMRVSKVDGYYLLFENSDDSPFIIDDHDYLDGVNEIISMMKAKGKVIVGRADIAFIPLLKHGIIITSPEKSDRRYSFKDKLVNPKIQEGSTGEESWGLRYYNEPLFNFIKDKSILETLATLGFETELGCDCKYCKRAKPFDSTTDKSHDNSRRHFYFKIAQLRNKLKGKKESEVNDFYAKHLKAGAKIAEKIELKTSSERFSRHERLIEIIEG